MKLRILNSLLIFLSVWIVFAILGAGVAWYFSYQGHEDAWSGYAILLGAIFAFGISFALVSEVIVAKKFQQRITILKEGLKRIQQADRPLERLEVDGKDSLAALAIEVNRLLAIMETSHRALERANAEMQQRVAERTAALAAANKALETDISQRIKAEQEREHLRQQLMRAHRMEAVGTLAGGIAHDFNNILTGILGHAQLMAADSYPGDPSELHIKQIMMAAERAAALVRQILAFSRQTPGERKVVAVGQVAREALSLLRAALPSGIAIRCTADDGNDFVEADPTQLHQVIMNLGTNAGHAMGSKGGVLEIKVEGRSLEDGNLSLPKGDYVSIAVKDSGCGMSPEVMERIFDPFFSTKPVNQGTGLGLAVVHGIVTEHGGAIDVESAVGEGTCFRILLPAVPRPQVNPETKAAAGRSPRGSERVLLVDDEDLVLGVVGKGLQRLGYLVTTESSGVAALERFERNPDKYDVVITDQTMPLMSGLELTAAIKQINPRIPIILATGYSPDVPDRDPGSVGLAAVIFKPVQFAALSEKIRLAMSVTRN